MDYNVALRVSVVIKMDDRQLMIDGRWSMVDGLLMNIVFGAKHPQCVALIEYKFLEVDYTLVTDAYGLLVVILDRKKCNFNTVQGGTRFTFRKLAVASKNLIPGVTAMQVRVMKLVSD